MQEISVEVQRDYLERMANTRQPILAVAELMWNGLDADANQIRVTFQENGLGGLETIRVEDNGHGIARDDAVPAFKNLGGSLKRTRTRSRGEKRMLHGQAGKGRFRAFSLGASVRWQTRVAEGAKHFQYSIAGDVTELGKFQIHDPQSSPNGQTGTEVTISRIHKNFRSLTGPQAVNQIAQVFALYLREYPHVEIWYDGVKVDPASVERDRQEIDLGEVDLGDGTKARARLTIIEWRVDAERALYLCDDGGFALGSMPPGIPAPGFVFTAYLRSNAVRDLDNQGLLGLEELSPAVAQLVAPAREKLRDHFRVRAAQQAADLVEEWKRENVYPYNGEVTDILGQSERQVFDVLALNVHQYLPGFDKADVQTRRFSLRLLRQAIEKSPVEVQRIIEEVLTLPREKRKDLADLLERTSLSAVINAAKTVAERLEFLRGLEMLVTDPQSEEELKERSQLHRILAEHTWIFGDEFTLTVDDQSLTEVLRVHLAYLGRDPKTGQPVKRADGKKGIIDLMLSKRIPLPNPEEREHLVVELKRPKQAVGNPEANQIIDYAVAVATDKRFRDVETKWVFWIVSNDLDDAVRRRVKQRNRPLGLLHDDEEQRIVVWAKTWGQVINACRARYEFFQQHLAYNPDNAAALKRLQELHAKLLPPSMKPPTT